MHQLTSTCNRQLGIFVWREHFVAHPTVVVLPHVGSTKQSITPCKVPHPHTMVRSWPNIAVTGTPGAGKSTHCELIIEALPVMRHMNVGTLVKEHGFHEGWDAEYQTYDVDEDALLDYLEPLSGKSAPEPIDDEEQEEDQQSGRQSDDEAEDRGGLLLDWHCCEAYPLRWVDLVVVLRCDHQMLWKRLEKRNYPLAKIKDNNEAEIMDFVLSEARGAYPAEAIVELRSESNEDIEANVERIVQWIQSWRVQHGFPQPR